MNITPINFKGNIIIAGASKNGMPQYKSVNPDDIVKYTTVGNDGKSTLMKLKNQQEDEVYFATMPKEQVKNLVSFAKKQQDFSTVDISGRYGDGAFLTDSDNSLFYLTQIPNSDGELYTKSKVIDITV